MLQKKLCRLHNTLSLAGIYRTCGAVESVITARSDFYKDQLSSLSNDEVDLAGFSSEVTFQNEEPRLRYEGQCLLFVIVSQ